MLTTGLVFFFLAILAAALGIAGGGQAPALQVAAWASCVLFFALFVYAMVRRSNRRSYRTR
jgi:membrane protein implicated in regulation of membrane protease activity